MICQLLICPANDPTGTPIETWTDDDILDLRLEISLNDLGRNTVRIPRHTWEGSALEASQSYYVRVNVPYIDNDDPFWGFWLIGGEFILVSSDERGGEDVTIGGPGPAWVLTKAVLNFEEWTDHAGTYVQEGTWYWANKNYGQILTDLINEDAASDHPALDFMEAPGWNNTNDVDGNPWEDFPGIFSASVGDNYLKVIRELQRADNLDVWVSPKLNIRAYVSYGRDLSGNSYGAGVVRFVGSAVSPDEPHNIIGELTRHKDGGKSFTHVLVTGKERREDGNIIEGSSIHRWAVDPDWGSGDEIHQGFMTYETSNTDILERAGLRLIRRSKDRSGRMVSCEVMPGQDEANGLYMPGAPGTDKGDYWIGDTVTFKTGAGDDFDLNNRDLTIAKIKMQLDTAADDTTSLSKERAWHTYIETGDDVSPSASASSSVNEKGQRVCRCPGFAPKCEEQEADTELVLTDCFDPTNGVHWPGTIVTTGACWGGDEHREAGASSSQTGTVSVSPGDIIQAKLNFREETGNNPWENVSNYAYRAYLRFEGSGMPVLDTLIVNQLYHLTGCINVTHTATETVPAGYSLARIVFLSRLGGWRYCGQILEITVADPVDNNPYCLVNPGTSPYTVHSDDPRLHDSHTAADVLVEDAGDYFTGTDVEAILQELGAGIEDTSVTPFDHGSMGATETVDLADGVWHRGTLTANVAVTVQGFTVDEGQTLLFGVTQDGTGGWDITWDTDVVFSGDDQPGQAAGDVTWYMLWSDEGDTTIYAAKVGAAEAVTFGTPALTLGTSNAAGSIDEAIRRDATILAFDATAPTTLDYDDVAAAGSATVAARRDHRHGMPSEAAGGGGIGPILISDTPSTPLVFADLIQNEAQDDLVYADT